MTDLAQTFVQDVLQGRSQLQPQDKKRVLHGLFLKKNPMLQALFLQAWVKTISQIFAMSEPKERKEIAWHHYLAILPYFEPQEGFTFSITHWQTGLSYEFTVKHIPLFKSPILGRYFNVNAYHLKPTQPGRHYLCFPGTLHFTAEGSCTTLLADFYPFGNVGKLLWSTGGQNVERLMHTISEPLTLLGASLGGALVHHAQSSMPEGEQHQAWAFVPPGHFFPRAMKVASHVQHRHIWAEHDPIAYCGFFPCWGDCKAVETKGLNVFLLHIMITSLVPDNQISPKRPNSFHGFCMFQYLLIVGRYVFFMPVLILSVVFCIVHALFTRK